MSDPTMHELWCAGDHADPDEHRSATIEVLPRSPEDEIARVWLESVAGSARPSFVALEFEGPMLRRRWQLRPKQARLVRDTLRVLRRIRQAAGRGDGHPPWCARTEEAGVAHRSPKQRATDPRDSQDIVIYLAQPVRGPEDEVGVVTLFEIAADDENSYRFMADEGQHERLEGVLTDLLTEADPFSRSAA
jgi:hypothetical protein